MVMVPAFIVHYYDEDSADFLVFRRLSYSRCDSSSIAMLLLAALLKQSPTTVIPGYQYLMPVV